MISMLTENQTDKIVDRVQDICALSLQRGHTWVVVGSYIILSAAPRSTEAFVLEIVRSGNGNEPVVFGPNEKMIELTCDGEPVDPDEDFEFFDRVVQELDKAIFNALCAINPGC